MSNQSEDAQGSTTPSKSNKSNDGSSSSPTAKKLSNWLHSVSNRQSPSPPSPNLTRGERVEPSDTVSSGDLDIVSESVRRDSGSSTSRDPEVEEEYQIQLALELSAKEDPEAVQIEAVKQISLGSCDPDNTPAEVVAYRYWNYNALGYDDKISDGFYDLAADSNLLKLEQKALELVVNSRKDFEIVIDSNLVRKLAIIVADYMGGSVEDPESMSRAWRSLSYSLKATLGSMVLPLGSLTIGLARHRALLFKVLADDLGIPCRLVKGLQYTGSDDVAMNFVKIDDGREYIVDLMAAPGTLIPSDATGSHIEYDESSFVATPSSRDLDSSHIASFSSGVGSSSEETSDFGTLERGNRSKHFVYSGKESDGNVQQETKVADNLGPRFLPPLPHLRVHPKASPSSQLEHPKPVEGLGTSLPLDTREASEQHMSSQAEATQYEQGSRSDGDTESTGYEPKGSDDVAEYDIPWEEIKMGERIGLELNYNCVVYVWRAGSYGEVYRGDWHGTEVAVKRFLDQDISGESLEEFKSEVQIMKRLRHPNVVLFMGAVTRPPNLSIVTEFLPRGSLYRLIHRPNNQLDERRRLRMALDAVCDFGLSRMKNSTFLSSRSTAGTAEWMAPEVLRNELSDEKCDVYSYGVILWELCTLQQPWGGMNPMQVVGAVGFQHRRLDIPDDMDPAIADIIRQCWQTDPKLRPTFAEIMAALKPLQKPITGSQVHRPSAQPSRVVEDPAG
ncbi:Serine-threonine/tyrosine-protein kinase, catalytic domain [Sesbania bispinosa]|nr:Serine-threonine/tyrosine-protein kinase, catalytic domain [Sesbania bispinosa]